MNNDYNKVDTYLQFTHVLSSQDETKMWWSHYPPSYRVAVPKSLRRNLQIVSSNEFNNNGELRVPDLSGAFFVMDGSLAIAGALQNRGAYVHTCFDIVTTKKSEIIFLTKYVAMRRVSSSIDIVVFPSTPTSSKQ